MSATATSAIACCEKPLCPLPQSELLREELMPVRNTTVAQPPAKAQQKIGCLRNVLQVISTLLCPSKRERGDGAGINIGAL